MTLTEELPSPTKILFTSRARCHVGAVFADRVVSNEREVVFYLGKARVALLDEESLVIGTRKIPRSNLDPVSPFHWDSQQSEH
jgi:hypothetical protein